jgi:metal-dependent amidase/aminoacylase/carboxypeptidase family protein
MEQSQLYHQDSLIELRRDIHKHAELFFQEKRTSAKIIEYLTRLGIKEHQIRRVTITGIIVDIQGQGPPSGKPFRVAFRADMDGLPIKVS